MTQMEREEQYLERQYADGQISYDEYIREMNQLERDYREAAHEAARDAYERELDKW